MIDSLNMALVRALHLAATLSLLGSAGFTAWVLPAAAAPPHRLRVRLGRLTRVSGLIAVVAGMAWFGLQAAVIADADDLSEWGAALPVVAAHTQFGNFLAVRLGLLIAATGLAWPGRRADTVTDNLMTVSGAPTDGGCVRLYVVILLTAVALGLQGMVGHAGAMAGAVGDGLVASETLHLLAAGIWLGALPPLAFCLFALSPVQAALVCERFTPIGLACVLLLAGTGLAQGFELIGGLPALFGTRYGHFALLKLALFLTALVLAALNRLRLTDRVAAGAVAARRHLALSVGMETMTGLAIIAAAAFMASSPPAAHTTPIRPFPWRFSLITVTEDAELPRGAVFSLLPIGGALALMTGALISRRLRLPASLRDDPRPPPWQCAAADAAAVGACPVVETVAPDGLAGTEFLVDSDGWLRAVHRPGAPGGRRTPERALIAASHQGHLHKPDQTTARRRP